MAKIDIIIPCGANDVMFVPKVVSQLRKYIVGVETIYVITNAKYINRIKKYIIDPKFLVLDENHLVGGLCFSKVEELMNQRGRYEGYGWIFQQFLKLGFSQTVYANDYYLSWDADTLPLQKIDFFDESNPIFTIKTEYHEPYFDTNERLIGIGKVMPYSFIAEHMVFKTEYVKDLISVICKSEVAGNCWVEKCVNACDFIMTEVFSEFELYGSFVTVKHPGTYKTRQLRTFRNGGMIRGRHINDKLLEQLSFDLDIASFEYKSDSPFPYNLDGWFWRKFRRFDKWKNMPMKELPKQIINAIRKRVKT